MSITTRLQDAYLLYERGHHEGALLNVLIAVAAASRRRFPRYNGSRNNIPDHRALKLFLSEEFKRPGQCAVCYKGEVWTIEQVLYNWMRNSLVHEAIISPEIIFCPAERSDEVCVQQIVGPPEQLAVTHTIVLMLAELVATSTEGGDVLIQVRESFWRFLSSTSPASTDSFRSSEDFTPEST